MKFSILHPRFSIFGSAASSAKRQIFCREAAGNSNRKSEIKTRKLCGAFSLVEVLAAIAIIGIITFLAIPNLLRIKEDGEKSLAISRAEALNMAMASFVQANGQASASSAWTAATDDAARYGLLTPYVAFAPASLSDYMPGGYSVTLPSSLAPIQKASLNGPSGSIAY